MEVVRVDLRQVSNQQAMLLDPESIAAGGGELSRLVVDRSSAPAAWIEARRSKQLPSAGF